MAVSFHPAAPGDPVCYNLEKGGGGRVDLLVLLSAGGGGVRDRAFRTTAFHLTIFAGIRQEIWLPVNLYLSPEQMFQLGICHLNASYYLWLNRRSSPPRLYPSRQHVLGTYNVMTPGVYGRFMSLSSS